MLIAKGRSSNQCLIEESLKVLECILFDVSKHIEEQEKVTEDGVRKTAIEGAGGDKDVEQNIYNSLLYTLEPFPLINDCFNESLVLASYSLYERIVKRIALSNSIVDSEKDVKKGYFKTEDFIKSIKEHSPFDPQIDRMIEEVKKAKAVRNECSHGEYKGFNKIELSKIKELLDKIKIILLGINSAVEEKNSQTKSE
jgi:hypothetical protein